MREDIEKFNREEAQFIARLILGRLEINEKSDHTLSVPDRYQSVIQKIESLEDIWKLDVDNKEHSFGRKKEGETIGLWSVPKMSAMVLGELVVKTGAKTILEVGTSAGYSTLFLSAGARQTGGKVFTIEILKEKIELAKNHFHQANADNITLIEDEASSVLSHWQNDKIDFVFLDADKENYGKYLDLLIPLMNIGGIIVADNINDYGHFMEDYLQKVSGTHLPESRCDRRVKSTYIAQLDNGLMITKKISD